MENSCHGHGATGHHELEVQQGNNLRLDMQSITESGVLPSVCATGVGRIWLSTPLRCVDWTGLTAPAGANSG